MIKISNYISNHIMCLQTCRRLYTEAAAIYVKNVEVAFCISDYIGYAKLRKNYKENSVFKSSKLSINW